MKVSVIVPIYNGANILQVTIPKLINQDYPKEKTEIIFVNDASTDDTEKIINSFRSNLIVTIVSHLQNKGRAATRNTGIKIANGELIIFLDCDIEVESSFISNHVKQHKQKKVIGILSNICNPEIKLKDKYQKYIFYGKRGAKIVEDEKPLPFKYFIMGCSSIKSEAIKKIGLFNENLSSYGIDLEYANRLAKKYPNNLYYSDKIKVFMHKVKNLDDALSDYYNYGQFNVPIILNEDPKLAPYVAADFVKSLGGKWSWKVLFGTIFVNPFIIQLVKRVLCITPFPLSNFLIRYLLAASIVTGYRKIARVLSKASILLRGRIIYQKL